MTKESCSMPSTSLRARSPSAAQATPKNSENTTICRISFVAIASTTERGTRCATSSFIESEATLRLGVVKPIAQHAVVKLAVAHAISPAPARDQVRRQIHVLHAAGHGDIDGAEGDFVRRRHNRL